MRLVPISLFLLVLVPATVVQAQSSFQRTYGTQQEDKASSLLQTEDGGFLVLGSSDDGVYIIKTDSAGTTLWQRKYNPPNQTMWYSGVKIIPAHNNGFIVLCGISAHACGLIKINNAGEMQWSKSYLGAGPYPFAFVPRDVIPTLDGGYAIVGFEGEHSEADVYLAKTDSTGNLLWGKYYGGSENDEGFAITQLNNGDFLLAGYSASFGLSSYDVYIIKTNTLGDMLWTKTIGSTDYEFARDIATTPDGGFVIAASYGVSNKLYKGKSYLVRCDSNANVLWSKKYQKANIRTVKVTAQGLLALTGVVMQQPDSLHYDACFALVDDNGTSVHGMRYGGVIDDLGNDIIQTSEGFAIAGWSNNFSHGSSDAYLLVADSIGSVGCEQDTFVLKSTEMTWSTGEGGSEGDGDSLASYVFVADTLNAVAYDPCVCQPPVANFYEGWYGFTDMSTWADTWFWDLGNGETSTEQNPNTWYSENDFYTICLTVSNECGVDTDCQTLWIGWIGIDEASKSNIKLFPNPANDFFIIEADPAQHHRMFIRNSLGQTVGAMEIEKTVSTISTIELPAGIYFLNVISGYHASQNLKLIIAK